MATNPDILAEGQLPNTKGTLFTATSRTIVRLISARHVSGGTQIVQFYIKKSGSSSRALPQAELEIDEAAEHDSVITLNTGDEIEGETTDAASVDYVITGAFIS